MRFEKLYLHSVLLPTMQWKAEQDDRFYDIYQGLACATVFDCRGLDLSFVTDTGQAAFEQSAALNERIKLPFPYCYFEFGGGKDGEHILAAEVGQYRSDDLSVVDQGKDPMGQYMGSVCEVWNVGPQGRPYQWGEFENGVRFDEQEPKFFAPINCDDDYEDNLVTLAAQRLLGVLTLLNEHLLATEVRPDPAPRLNVARLKKGKLPLSAETRVLTINTAAVRAATHRHSLRSHESPRLHWRRGHWRILHRGSEFESKAWVSRCLVGDPARGTIHKDYRLIWRQGMLS